MHIYFYEHLDAHNRQLASWTYEASGDVEAEARLGLLWLEPGEAAVVYRPHAQEPFAGRQARENAVV